VSAHATELFFRGEQSRGDPPQPHVSGPPAFDVVAEGGGFAFAASRAGFLGRILFSGIGESVAENTARAAVNGEDLSDAMVQGLFDGMINLGVGEAINLGISRIGSPLLAALLDRVNANRTFKPFTRDNFHKNLAKPWKTKSPPAGYDAHHMLPVKYEDRFNAAGINIHHPYFGAWWESSEHRKFKDFYNDAWDDFFEDVPTPSIDEILDKARDLAAEYGLSTNF
jgi:hypothetical protein